VAPAKAAKGPIAPCNRTPRKVDELSGNVNLQATPDKLQIQYLTRRFALSATAAALIASLAFGSGRRP